MEGDFPNKELVDKFVKKIIRYSDEDRDKIAAAAVFAAKKHGDQKRKTGEPYITHPMAVAEILMQIGMDADTVSAGLLHDTLEDTDTTEEEISTVFGKEVGEMVQAVTKISRITDEKSIQEAETIKKYIEFLEDAFIVTESTRYDIKGRKYIGTPKKYYFEDAGLRNARLGFRQVEENHIMDNVIYNELRSRGYSVDVGVVENVKKQDEAWVRKSLEVDFVVNAGDRRYYIQSACELPSEKKMAQEQASLLAIDDAFRKIVIVNSAILSGYNEQGILLVSLSDFLFDPERAINY